MNLSNPNLIWTIGLILAMVIVSQLNEQDRKGSGRDRSMDQFIIQNYKAYALQRLRTAFKRRPFPEWVLKWLNRKNT